MAGGWPRPDACVGAVVVRGDEILLVRRGHGPAGGRWSIPGGRIEWGETTAEAVVREVAEETGLTVVCGGFVGWFEVIEPAGHRVILDFEATVIGGELRAGDDAAEATWVPLDKLSDIRLTDGLIEFLVEHDVIDDLIV